MSTVIVYIYICEIRFQRRPLYDDVYYDFIFIGFYYDLQWGAADAEITSHLLRTQSSKVLPLKPGVGQYIAIHAMSTARDFF